MFLWIATIFGLLWIVLTIRYIRDTVLDWLSYILGDWVDPWLSRILIFAFSILSFIMVLIGTYSMLPLWIGAVVCGLLWEFWSNDKIRDASIEWLEHGMPFVLSIGFIVFATLLVYNSWFKELPITIPPIGSQPAPELPKIVEPPKIEGPTFPGKIVYRDSENKIIPISGAKIQVGQNDAISDANGSFQVPLRSIPNGDTLVRISHDNYVARFLRFDDPIISSQRQIELTRKMRIVVLETGEKEKDAIKISSDLQNTLTSNLENYLRATDEIELLVDPNFRDYIIKQLYQYQQGRALYDPATLQRVGDFRGATHGLFWTVKQQKGSLLVECKLVDFKTTRLKATADVIVEDENSLISASAYLADLLLAQLADIKILSPKTGTEVGHQLSVEGYALYRPNQWSLYVTLLPDGNSLHYPQQEITVKSDGSWFASSFYVGDPKPVYTPLKYRVYAVLVHPDHTAKIEDYIRTKNTNGLDLNSWDKKTYKFLDHIEVTRIDSKINPGSR